MEFVNLISEKKEETGKDSIERMIVLLSPFAPHIAEELWQTLGHEGSASLEKWPVYDKNMIKEGTITLIVQINSRVRDKVEVSADISEEEAKKLTFERPNVIKWVQNKEIKKVVFIPGKLINIVI
jgi:leucyl-tRNA synthetase